MASDVFIVIGVVQVIVLLSFPPYLTIASLVLVIELIPIVEFSPEKNTSK
jgi:hypothetical protein